MDIDKDPKDRKYKMIGKTLFGFAHGDRVNPKTLPLTRPADVPEKWRHEIFREVHTGHKHKEKRIAYVAVDENKGVRVRGLPSLSSTDAWHFKEGYVEGVRGAELYLWSHNYGFRGLLPHIVQPEELKDAA